MLLSRPMVGEAAKYNSACVNTSRRSFDGYKLPSYQRNLVAVLLKNSEFIMSEETKIKSKNNDNSEEIVTKNDQKLIEKSRPFWKKTIIFISKYSFLAFAYVLEYFLNRARFGLMAVCTFNIILIAFVFSEWFIYFTFFTIFLPNSIRDLLQTS